MDVLDKEDEIHPFLLEEEIWVKEKVARHVLMLYKGSRFYPKKEYFDAGCVRFTVQQIGPKRPVYVFAKVLVKRIFMKKYEKCRFLRAEDGSFHMGLFSNSSLTTKDVLKYWMLAVLL